MLRCPACNGTGLRRARDRRTDDELATEAVRSLKQFHARYVADRAAQIENVPLDERTIGQHALVAAESTLIQAAAALLDRLAEVRSPVLLESSRRYEAALASVRSRSRADPSCPTKM
jgi:hypothetical protein